MQLRDLIALALVAAGMAGGLLSNVVYWVMLGEVNATKPENEQYSIWWSDPFKFSRIWQEHSRLYPQRHRRGQCVAAFLGGLFLCLGGVAVHFLL